MSRGSSSRLARYIRLPLRVLNRARDFYVNTMNGCAARMPTATIASASVGPWTTVGPTMQRNFSTASSRSSNADEDLAELIRAASQSKYRQQPLPLPRSQSVVVGRIDEDKEVHEFDDEAVRVGGDLLLPRSRSYAVAGRKKRLAFLLS